jgi:hypothetical protein
MKQSINEIKRMQQLAGLINESQLNEESAYIEKINPEYPTQITLVSDSGEYGGDVEENGEVSFSLIFEDDNVGTYMNDEDIFEDYAPEVFKTIKDAGGRWEAGDDYVQVTISLDKLKELFPIK